nr:YfjP family GTPase [Streptomyces sulfonofaciens]
MTPEDPGAPLAPEDPELPTTPDDPAASSVSFDPSAPSAAVASSVPSGSPGEASGQLPNQSEGVWDDGLIARRAAGGAQEDDVVDLGGSASALTGSVAPDGEPRTGRESVYDAPLRDRLDALRELVGLSRTRVESGTLAEAGRVLDEASARGRLSGRHTVVALAGATGSGKSSLFNALAGVTISDTGARRPTTSFPVACSWSDDAAPLLDRLGIPARLRRRPPHNAEAEAQLSGLILVDLPDHDSAAVAHREQVDRVLALVDAVIWVVDPEKYADAVLHDRYLRPMAGHAEVMFIVLNQVDRLPGEAADQVLDDLRRLLDEDGVALGEHGEPGATVLAVSAATGRGIGELRGTIGQFVARRGAAGRRIAADVSAVASGLRPVYAAGRQYGLSEEAREEFADRLAEAIGATAAGVAAERAWRRNASKACGSPWLRLWRRYESWRFPRIRRSAPGASAAEEATARQRVEQAVRTVAEQAAAGLPAPWAQAVREAAVRGARGLPRALDELAVTAGVSDKPPRPGWWPVAVLTQAAMTLMQIVGGLWLSGQILGLCPPNLGVPVMLMSIGVVGGPLVDWACRVAARGPARRYGLEAERRLREAAAGCGRARVLDPVSGELLRYAEVREQYVRVLGTAQPTAARVG